MNSNQYVVYNDEYKVLICKQHQYAITAKSIVAHFRDKHDITKDARQKIIDYASQFAISEIHHLAHPTDRIAPIPHLKVIEGYICQYAECTLISGTLESVKQHCKVVHNWKIKEGTCWRKTSAQSFHHNTLARLH